MSYKTFRFIAIVTLIHAAITTLSLIGNCLVVTPGFGVYEPAPLWKMGVIAFSFLVRMPIMVPLLFTNIGPFDGVLALLPLLANSLVWGITAWFIFSPESPAANRCRSLLSEFRALKLRRQRPGQ